MVTLVGVAILFGLLYFAVGTLGVAAVTLLAAAAIGPLVVLVMRTLAVVSGRAGRQANMLAAAGATAFGTLLQAGFADYRWEELVGVAVAALTAFLFSIARTREQVTQCSICRTPVSGRVSFVCPRCHQTVCSRPTCWQGQHARCRLCHEREVVLFPMRGDWWTARLGKRLVEGTCQSCYKEAREADLHECGQCHWASCRRCWDYNNGRCVRCGWVMPDLPASIRPFVASPEQQREVRPRTTRH